MMTTGEQVSNSPVPKQPKMECIIHCSDDGDKLVSLQSVDSWRTLLRSAQICNHAPVIELAKDIPEGQIPAIYYHRKCCSICTMKKVLNGILKNKKQSASGSAEEKNPREQLDIPQAHQGLMTWSTYLSKN